MFQATLALIATNIGGGIVGIPYAFYNFGIPLGTSLIIMVSLISLASAMLLLKSKELCKQESFYDIGYIVLGRSSIFIISGAIICQLFGITVVYYIVFSDTMSLLFAQMNTGNSVTQVLPADQVAAEMATKSPIVQFFA